VSVQPISISVPPESFTASKQPPSHSSVSVAKEDHEGPIRKGWVWGPLAAMGLLVVVGFLMMTHAVAVLLVLIPSILYWLLISKLTNFLEPSHPSTIHTRSNPKLPPNSTSAPIRPNSQQTRLRYKR
jgi:hypothetical protein